MRPTDEELFAIGNEAAEAVVARHYPLTLDGLAEARAAELRAAYEVGEKAGRKDRDVFEARAAYWHAEYLVATQPPGSPAALGAVEASSKARARLDELGAAP